jgi:SAM-dependent methyltransferase
MTDSPTLAASYDAIYASDAAAGTIEPLAVRGWPVHRNEALVFLARPGGRLLEIGSGVGSVLLTLAPRHAEVVGTELSPVRAEAARARLAHLANVRIHTGDLASLAAVEQEPFDAILWADVIEHVGDVIGAMKTIACLARPGTQLVTVTPNVAYIMQRVRALRGRAPNTSLPYHGNEGFTADPAQTVLLDGGHFHYFTFRQLELLYRIAGFEPEARLGFGSRLSRLRNRWPTLLSGAVCIAGTYRPAAAA